MYQQAPSDFEEGQLQQKPRGKKPFEAVVASEPMGMKNQRRRAGQSIAQVELAFLDSVWRRDCPRLLRSRDVGDPEIGDLRTDHENAGDSVKEEACREKPRMRNREEVFGHRLCWYCVVAVVKKLTRDQRVKTSTCAMEELKDLR